jgi:hypothetical protein
MELRGTGHYKAFLHMCGIGTFMGGEIRRKTYKISPAMREKLTKGFRMLDAGKVYFAGAEGEHPGVQGRQRQVAHFREDKPDIGKAQNIAYAARLMDQLKAGPHDRQNLSLPPLPSGSRTPFGRR